MFENVQFFSHLHLKYVKSAIMTPKIFSWKISIWVSKNAEFYADFKRRLKQMPLKKARAIFSWFFALTFVWGISESRHQRI
jgi:hypothetical protein